MEREADETTLRIEGEKKLAEVLAEFISHGIYFRVEWDGCNRYTIHINHDKF